MWMIAAMHSYEKYHDKSWISQPNFSFHAVHTFAEREVERNRLRCRITIFAKIMMEEFLFSMFRQEDVETVRPPINRLIAPTWLKNVNDFIDAAV